MFKIICRELEPDQGAVVFKRGVRIGYLSQHDEWSDSLLVKDYLESAEGLPLWELKALALGLGLNDNHFESPIMALSGGFRMRCKLLFLIAQEPDLLLLDEPTNYLDLESLLVLESFLQGYRRAFMLISHDREFLRRTTDHILEVEGGDIIKYPGSLDDYLEQKELLRRQLLARAYSVEEKKKQILDFVRRFGAKATKAKQAQSRLKSLDKMEDIDVKPLPHAARIVLPAPGPTSKVIVKMENVQLGYDDHAVLSGVNFELKRGDHLAVVGYNGAGKSTLLKSLAGLLQPQKGLISKDPRAIMGYYAQHVAEALSPTVSVAQALQSAAHFETTRQEVLNLAGSLLFSKDDLNKPVSVLSGGEKSRVALGQILLRKAPCLLLDEPTNHLDFQTVEALTQSLRSFPGTLVVISHDRSFIAQVATKILEIRDGGAQFYPGTYNEYVWSVSKGTLSQRAAETENQSLSRAPKDPKVLAKDARSIRKSLEKQIKSLEREIKGIEKSLFPLDSQLRDLNAALTTTQDPELQRQLVEELAKAHSSKEELENQWLALEQQKQKASTELEQL